MNYYRGEAAFYDTSMIPPLFRNEKYSLDKERKYYSECIDLMAEILKIKRSKDLDYNAIALGKLQHYNVPTRLLDVTKNILVAKYFASCKEFNKDGFIYQLSNIPVVLGDDREIIRRKINIIFKYDYSKQRDIFSYFRTDNQKTIHSNTITDAVILDYKKLYAKMNVDNLRYERQQGSFVFFGNKIDQKGSILDEINYLMINELKKTKVRIKSSEKLEILYSLVKDDKINYVYLFPDESISIDLMVMYKKIFIVKTVSLQNFINIMFEKHSYYKNFISQNILKFYKEFANNESLFYFVFYEFLNYIEIEDKEMATSITLINKILEVA